MSTNNILRIRQSSADHRAVAGHRAGLLLSDAGARRRAGQGMAFASQGEIETPSRQVITRIARSRAAPGASTRWPARTESLRHDAGRIDPRQLICPHTSRYRSTSSQLEMTKEISNMIDTVLPQLRSEGQGDLLRPHHVAGASARRSRPHFLRQGRHGSAGDEDPHRRPRRAPPPGYEQQYNDGLITPRREIQQGRRRLVEMLGRARQEMMICISACARTSMAAICRSTDLHDVAFGRAQLATQMRQLARRCAPDGQALGEIIESPIISKLQGNLTVLEYLNSTHGARRASPTPRSRPPTPAPLDAPSRRRGE